MTTSAVTLPSADSALSAATRVSRDLARSAPADRARGLRAVADVLREHRAELTALADEETALGTTRLDGEITRTAFQLELFAQLLDDTGVGGEVVDRADPDYPPAPRPDLRRRLLPIGVVAMFSASNFPFAFSVVGGDTASALAAGCPVVVKAHSGHPRLSRRVAELARAALDTAGLPADALTLVEGREAGRALVLDDRVDAVAFTGSTDGGRALFDLAVSRPRPIPFFGELGSVNPVFVTERAAASEGDRIWRELAASFTLGAGQFCTKPGIVFVPRVAGAGEAVASHLDAGVSWRMLDSRIADGFGERVSETSGRRDVEVVVAGDVADGLASPTLLRTDVGSYLADPEGLGTEMFGPATLLVEYDDEQELLAAAEGFVGELTGTLQALEDDDIAPSLIELLESRVGRIVWNQWPTGVSVTGAMQHGGPYPASTSSRDTSVGTTAIARFLRPVAYQNVPSALLPESLRG